MGNRVDVLNPDRSPVPGWARAVVRSLGPLSLRVHQRVALVTLEYPERRNALGPAVRVALREAIGALATDADVWAVVLTGAGPVFSAGADFRDDLSRMTGSASAVELMSEFIDLFRAVEHLPQPVVAAVNGPALAGGMELVLACDLVVAAESARFGLPETRVLGVPPAYGMARLPGWVGLARAKRLILTGAALSAREALAAGLVTAVVPGDELLSTARLLAEELAGAAPLSARLAKALLNARSESASPDLPELVRQAAQLFATQDVRRAVEAFAERRAPVFQGN